MEKWVGFVGFSRTHGQGMWKFTVRLGNLQKGKKQQEKEGWRGGMLYGLFSNCHHFLCMLGPCFLIPSDLEPLLLELGVVTTDTVSASYPLGPLGFTCSFDAQLLYIPMASCVKNQCLSVSTRYDVHLEYRASPLCLVYKITKSHPQTLMEERWLSTPSYLLP